jgi:hypothetical protein
LFARSGDSDRPTPSELEETFVTKEPKGAKHGVRVDAEDRCKVLSLRDPFARLRLTVGDGPANRSRDLFVKRSRIAPVQPVK